MSDRHPDRRFTPVEAVFCAAALLGGLFLVAWIALHIGEQKGRESAASAYQQDGAPKGPTLACLGGSPIEIAHCSYEQAEARAKQAHDQQDLEVQKDIAFTGLLAFCVSVVSAGATIWALLYVRGTLEATREALKDTGEATTAMLDANKIARDIGHAQARAYLSVIHADYSQIGNFLSPFGNVHKLILHFNNSGATPASNVAYFCGCELTDWNTARQPGPRMIVPYVTRLPNIPASSTHEASVMAHGIRNRISEYRSALEKVTQDTAFGTMPAVLIWGAVFYDDIFGNTFRSDYGFILRHEDHMADVRLPMSEFYFSSFCPIDDRAVFVAK